MKHNNGIIETIRSIELTEMRLKNLEHNVKTFRQEAEMVLLNKELEAHKAFLVAEVRLLVKQKKADLKLA